MQTPLCTVTFHPWNRTVSVPYGATLLEAAIDNDIPLEHACGGNCSCTTCHLHVQVGGESIEPPLDNESEKLDELARRHAHSRLACQTSVTTDLVVKLPSIL